MEFTDKEFEEFTNDVKEALRGVCQKYNLKRTKTYISYGKIDFDMKITFQKDEEDIDVERIKFEEDCAYYGFVPDDYLRTFEYHGRTYELYAFIPRAKKYKCMVRDIETGAKLKMTDRYLLNEFGHDFY
ncbi:MAG: hypothetical protein Q4E53_09675 [Eubacteriales bacterium]|nr:hypothetical protein [Eubacteriales bacterium]